jgi:hypothetical protein
MSRHEDEPTRRVHVLVFADDWEWIKRVYGKNIGESAAVRQIVRRFRNRIEEQTEQDGKRPPIAVEDVIDPTGVPGQSDPKPEPGEPA